MCNNHITKDYVVKRFREIKLWERAALLENCGVVADIRGQRRRLYCKDRFCPTCGRFPLLRVKDSIKEKTCLMSTLTFPNLSWDKLKVAFREMQKMWRAEYRRRRPTGPWIRILHISTGRDGEAHPHFHVLGADMWEWKYHHDVRRVDTAAAIRYLARPLFLDLSDVHLLYFVRALDGVRCVSRGTMVKKGQRKS